MSTQNIDKHQKKKPLFWVSFIRIFATILIFSYHYQGLYHTPNDIIAVLGVSLFLFISGFLAYKKNISPHKWIINRFKQILIPYWLVIIPVFIVNEVIVYKQNKLIEKIIIFLGGSFFVEDPLYVLTWFITVILMFYLAVYLMELQFYFVLKIILFLVFLFFFNILGVADIYTFSFFAGYFLRMITIYYGFKGQPREVPPSLNAFNTLLFYIQNHSYSFFLIHGGILLFTVKIIRLHPSAFSFVFAFLITAFFSIYHKKVSDFLLKRL